jgi:hypothetical protein
LLTKYNISPGGTGNGIFPLELLIRGTSNKNILPKNIIHAKDLVCCMELKNILYNPACKNSYIINKWKFKDMMYSEQFFEGGDCFKEVLIDIDSAV